MMENQLEKNVGAMMSWKLGSRSSEGPLWLWALLTGPS